MRFLVGLCVFLLSAPVWAAQPTQADLRRLEQQIQQEKQAGEVSGRKAAEMSGEVKTVQRQIVQLARTVREKEDDLTRLEKRQAQTVARQKELTQKLNLTNKQLVQIMSGMQTLALRPSELAYMRSETPLNMLRSRMVMGYSVPIINGTNRQVRQDLAELSRLNTDLQTQIIRIKSTRNQLSEQSNQMDRLLQQKSLLQAQYQVSQQQSQARVKDLGAQARDIKDLLAKLEQEKKYQAAQNAMRRTQNNRPAFKQAPLDNGAFARAYGRLPYPLHGTTVAHFGDTMVGGAHTKGITISGRPSARVIAPFDGMVLFAGPFKNYGELVILDHGDDYLVLLAGMDHITTAVGQEVLAGEPIGQVKSARPELYLEIRKSGQAIDPEPWFSKNS